MIFSFLFFCLIGAIPYAAAYFVLGVNWLNIKGVASDFVLFYVISAFIKLFVIALALPEVEGFSAQYFVLSMVISSFEFVPFHLALRKNNKDRSRYIAYWWATATAFVTCIFQFISNSRTYELEAGQVINAIAAISYLFQWAAAKNVSSSISKRTSIFNIPLRTQAFILALGLPQAMGSLAGVKGVPSYMPDVMRVVASVVIYLASRLLTNDKKHKE